jgi:hypothetical protein
MVVVRKLNAFFSSTAMIMLDDGKGIIHDRFYTTPSPTTQVL